MAKAPDTRDLYRSHFNAFEKTLNGAKGSPLHAIRREALAGFMDHGFPTMREEDWKYTNLAPLAKIRFSPAPAAVPGDRAREALARDGGEDDDAHRLVFVNGRFAPGLSRAGGDAGGAVIGSLAAALADHPDVIAAHLARHADGAGQPLVALNTAFIADGAFIHVPDGVALARPVHLVFLSDAPEGPAVCHPRNLVVAGRGSQVRVVEHYATMGGEACFTNAVTEIAAGAGAVIDHCRVQRESESAFHVGNVTARQARDSSVTSWVVSLGGALVRNDVWVLLQGEGAGCAANGLYMAGGSQHVDNHTVIDHAVPHCASNENYKGILDGKATAVFNGEIIVREDAQKTDAHQLNKNLVLSEDALIHTKPRLRIHANDVKCTHGATVGMLDQDALFYLQSRGFPREEAKNMLTYAFATEIIEPIGDAALRRAIERQVLVRLPAVARLGELA
ncbi:MAG: Fe-S cluster assembly protein SufD [Myxococcota bacterium]